MRVHMNQINANAQLDAMQAAQKAAAKREAARTRKKLMEFASEVAGEAEAEDCVVRLGARDEPQEGKRQNQPQERDRKSEGDDSKVVCQFEILA